MQCDPENEQFAVDESLSLYELRAKQGAPQLLRIWGEPQTTERSPTPVGGPHVRKQSVPFVVDIPPRYSEVFPPTYEWALQHGHKQPNIVSKCVDGADVAQPHLPP
uniref:Uncharacterized protein n=1 Tax=Ascaris lumbricoides TaxID=6252 RepID=A0A0M3IED7_ASCLU